MTEFEQRPRPATSADVARESGVSRATVSYVLNETPNKRISATTRLLVLATARRLGHVPNPQALALKTGSSNIVLCLVPALTLGFVFEHALDVLTGRLAEHGYALLINKFKNSGEQAGSAIWRHVVPKLVVVVGGLPSADIAPIAARSTAPVISDFGIVEHRRIGRMQAEHLLAKGHTCLGFALPADPDLRIYADQRCAGVQEVCAAAGVAPPVAHTVDNDLDTHRAALGQWSAAGITGICAHNDDVALLLLDAMEQLGLTAPANFAVVGSDDVPLAQAHLTTVAVSVDVLPARMVAHVFAALGVSDPEPPSGDMLKLIERSST